MCDDAGPGAGVLPDRPGVLLPPAGPGGVRRTLFGAKPPRGQELEDHYFGAIPDRVLACMMEVERELYRLGVPVKTRHNEVAPGQFEMAPIYENANIAADHQQLLMLVLRRSARKYGLVALLHEKPFAGRERQRQAPELVVRHGRAEPARAGRQPARQHAVPVLLHGRAAGGGAAPGPAARVGRVRRQRSRLGANEAPPAIISVFLGDQLTDVFEQIEKLGSAKRASRAACWASARPCCRSCRAHAGDRNRTSPFAFTGNKFEFRALGASQSISFPATVLNTIVAESIDELCTELEAGCAKGARRFEDALRALLAREIASASASSSTATATARVARGGGAPRAAQPAHHAGRAPRLTDEKNIALFEKYGVLSRASWSRAPRSSSTSTSRRSTSRAR
jgi:glutamine synthetase